MIERGLVGGADQWYRNEAERLVGWKYNDVVNDDRVKVWLEERVMW